MHSVDPLAVKQNAVWLSPDDIVAGLLRLPWAPYITFTGGDPCIWPELGLVQEMLNVNQRFVAVETQGTVFPEWLPNVDVVTFSPKPPSSRNPVDVAPLIHWLNKYASGPRTFKVCVKIVVFDQQDFEYAYSVYSRLPYNTYDAFYFTAGTPHYKDESPLFKQRTILRSMRLVTNTVLNETANPLRQVVFNDKVHIGAQMHALLWPDKDKGV